jgi:uncharacterized coiled-coil protein SlyX
MNVQALQTEMYALSRIVAQLQLSLEQQAAQAEDLNKQLEAAQARIAALEGGHDAPPA